MRQYLRHLGQFTWENRLVEYSLYLVAPKVLDAEGMMDGAPFDNFNELAKMARWNQVTVDGFSKRLREIVEVRL